MKNYHPSRLVILTLLVGFGLLTRAVPAAEPAPQLYITEFMAINNDLLLDEDGNSPDWVEIHNPGDSPVNLAGWHLTDNAGNLTKWTFPSTNLLAGEYLIVFASNKDRDRVGTNYLHTNFRLTGDGEFLALVRPDGSIASSYSPAYPPQVSNVSYGLPTASSPEIFLGEGDAARVHVPTSDVLGTNWIRPGFDDATWQNALNGVGYERDPGLSPNLNGSYNTDLETQMHMVNSSAYLRIPFQMTDPGAFDILTLRMKYDDAFVAYLNGFEVVRRGLADGVAPVWNALAESEHPDEEAVLFEDFDLTDVSDGLQPGENVLAVHGLNVSVSDNDFLMAAEFQGRTMVVLPNSPRYFATPTPGAPNGTGVDDLGPIISEVDHQPQVPRDEEDMVVAALLTPTFDPVGGAVLRYRIQLSTTDAEVPMTDDGLNGDAVAGDGIFSATIPAGAASPGEFIRWYITASDTQGRASRYPPFEDPMNSAQYDGTIVHLDPPHDLPILHWLIANTAGADNNSSQRYPGALFFEGRFYDNIGANRHGQSSGGFPVKSYDIDFNPGENFRWKDGELLVDDINLISTYADKANMRNILAYDTYREAGGTHHFVRNVRVHRNGSFLALYHLMENGDANWMERLGKDPDGALYKMYNTFSSLQDTTISGAEAEKKTRKDEGSEDLVELFNRVVQAPLSTRTNNMMDMVNLPATVNYLAARVITADRDCCHKNYYLYRDTEGTGEWEGLPWDVDLSFGRNWNSTDNYWDNNLQFNNGLFVGNNNGLFQNAIFGVPYARQMYLRRIRTLMDTLLQPPGTLPTDLKYETRINQLLEELRGDSADDLAANGTWVQGSAGPTMNTALEEYESIDEAVLRLKNEFLEPRREFMFSKQISPAIPDAQPQDIQIELGALDVNPLSANQDEEFIQLINPHDIAVDISGWQLAGAVEHEFIGGTVLPAGFSLYVSPNVRAFRARALSPTGGEGRFVQGNYRGQLSARGETVVLVNAAGQTNAVLTYPGAPSPAQQYLRVTEIMYHPAPPETGSPFIEQDFEYIELKNIGPATLPLAGIKFVEGIRFNFNTSAVSSLDPGQSLVLVRNEAAFVSRHGAGALMGGAFDGFLDNAGETLRLLDNSNEKVLEFDYENSWYPITDGFGFSLVIVDETAPFNTWDLKQSWRPSGVVNGSPGHDDPVPAVIAPILVNEALTHTDLPLVDAIELYNPTGAEVNVSGWFLTDDYLTPRKYRIPDGTTIGTDGHLVISEPSFNPNPGVPPSFSLSSRGDEVYLFSGNGTDLTGYFHGHDFGAAENGVSFGRHVNSQTNEHFVAQSLNTPGGPNALPKVGPIVISEIMYHPPDLPGAEDNQSDEYVELLNISGNTVLLHDPAFPTNSWQLRDAVDFKFPTTASLDPGEILLVVSFDPTDALAAADFRNRNNVPLNVELHGPYRGKLDNSSEDVELFRPDSPDVVGGTPFIRVDKVDYKDDQPWPSVADGFGPSLNRVFIADYGNDPINWNAAAPTPGRASSGGVAPTITLDPLDQIGVLTREVIFTVEAAGAEPLAYQWRFDGNSIPGANGSSLRLAGLRLGDAGLYDVVVFNGSGAAISASARLEVAVPAVILAQPQSQNVRIGLEAVFTVEAVSASPITYRWTHNGVLLEGQTGPSLTLTAVTEEDNGEYQVEVTDEVGTVFSEAATLLVLVDPEFVLPYPTRFEVIEGSDLIIGMEVTGTLPIGFRWREGSLTLRAVVVDRHEDWFVKPDIALTDNGKVYTCVITNAAFFSPGNITPRMRLTVLADADQDGLGDQWEIDNMVDDPNDDPDGDGMTNLEEQVAGTDPNDPGSYLRVDQPGAGEPVTIEFPVVANKTYTLQYKNSLGISSWTKLKDIRASTVDQTVVVEDPEGNVERYYRLVTPRQE